MKKILILILISLVLISILVSCNKKDTNNVDNSLNETDVDIEPCLDENNEEVTSFFGSFKTKDLHGNSVDCTVFSNYDFTIVNIWGTFCKPCIDEMPELQKLYEELKEKNINMIGLCADVNKDTNKDIASSIVQQKGVKFVSIIPDEVIQDFLSNNIQAFPTTFIMNNKGEIVGKEIVGARSYEEYKKIINDTLEFQ